VRYPSSTTCCMQQKAGLGKLFKFQGTKELTRSMPQAPASEAQFTLSLPLPTDEELAIIMELKAERAQLLETKSFFAGLVKYVFAEIQEKYKDDFNLRQETDNLRAELVKVALESGLELPQDDKWKQSTSTRAVESIDDFTLRMLKASERIGTSDLPPDVPNVIPYSDSHPHTGAAAFDLQHYRTDADASLILCGTQAAAPNAATCEDLTSRTVSSVEASDVNTSMEVNNAAPYAVPQRSPISIPIQQAPTTAAISDSVEPTATSKELEVGWKLESSLMHTTSDPWSSWSSSGSENVRMQGCMGVCKSPSQHPKPVDSCKDLPVALPPQHQGLLHRHAALETAGASCEPSPSAPGDTGGVTTLVIRNIPARYTKEILLQEWLVDGTFDFIYLPFSFKQKRTAGYAFVNFASSAAASAFQSQWHGRPLCAQVSSSKLSIGAAEVQGLEENVRHLINCKINRVKNPKYLPTVFDGLREIPFGEYVEQLERGCKSASAEQQVKLHIADDVLPEALCQLT